MPRDAPARVCKGEFPDFDRCLRKLRFATSGRGKRGGARVIYYFLDERLPIYALLAYPKSAKTDLTPDERRAVSKFGAALKATRKQMK